MDAPRDDLIRAQFGQIEAGEGRTLTGYPIVFDTFTTINSYEGQFRERISFGALTKTLAERGGQVKVLFNHGMDAPIGEKPLGKPSVQQVDSRGLYVEVPLAETSYNDDILALVRAGALDGMSFRFSVVNEEWDTPKRGLPERTITELRLFEYGPVTFPAYEATTVGIRSHELYARWRGLTDEKRAAISDIMGTAVDLRTLLTEPLESTPVDESRDAIPDEPVEDHSEATQTSGAHTARAKKALRQERARQLGVIQ